VKYPEGHLAAAGVLMIFLHAGGERAEAAELLGRRAKAPSELQLVWCLMLTHQGTKVGVCKENVLEREREGKSRHDECGRKERGIVNQPTDSLAQSGENNNS
jgi:hypothetical protein